ncbi:MAG: tetratricopeptide repeat protein [Heliobacteriaceae bacterium]|jgi:tetratricopeptide (TPR) repeat protein|nr:tetratricopeptide repeat protein [Heliobacteriaceae bacterium]
MKKFILAALIILAGAAVNCAEPYTPSTEAKLEYNQGVDFYKIGQYDRAIGAFRQAVNLDPNYIDAYFNLGSILEYLNQHEAALSVFKQIIVRKPDDYESLYKAADISVKLGQTDKAKEYLAAIPPESSIYPKAQELAAANLHTDMQAIKQQQQQISAGKEQFTGDESLFNNIASPTGIAADSSGNVYIASFSDNTIYKITPDGKRVIFLKDSKINGPIGMVRDEAGNIYLANYNNNNVLKITPTGSVTALLSNVQKPYGLYIAGKTLFISCQGSNSVVRYKLN